MISISECRRLLSDDAGSMTDGEVERLRNDLYGVADVLVDVCLSRWQQSSAEHNAEPEKIKALTSGRQRNIIG